MRKEMIIKLSVLLMSVLCSCHNSENSQNAEINESVHQSTNGNSEDYSLPLLTRIASKADREKGFPKTEINNGIKYRVFYFSAGDFIPFEDPVTHQLSSIVVPDVGQPPDGSDDYMEKRRLWIESHKEHTAKPSDKSQ